MAKTALQIQKYIESQEWGEAFKENLKSWLSVDIHMYLREIADPTYKGVILNAFSWGRTPQGHKYWKSVEGQYLNWLRDEKSNFDHSILREGFNVEIEENPDAREGFQQIVRVKIGSTRYGLPAISIKELESLHESIGAYLRTVTNK